MYVQSAVLFGVRGHGALAANAVCLLVVGQRRGVDVSRQQVYTLAH